MDVKKNVFWVGAAGFEGNHDKVIILQDTFRSGRECQTCLDENKRTISGKEVSTVRCDNCDGIGSYEKKKGVAIKCSQCDGSGWMVCPDCEGKGGTIILPEVVKGRPTTGTIVSLGPNVPERWKRGDKCIYPSFAGHAYDLVGEDEKGRSIPVVLVIMREEEILSKMYGSLEYSQVKKSMALHTNA